MGAPADVIAAATRKSESDDGDVCYVWEENWDIAAFFCGLGTQWIISGMGAYVGINYQSIESVMRIKAVPENERAAMFDDIQIMERSALDIVNKKER